jgi:ADP-ribose 1''-phosphate phosphatase
MELNYVKGDLFEIAPEEAYLLHACNCVGVWGAGIAKEFKRRYFASYSDYFYQCSIEKFIPGNSLITKDNIICLGTSHGYGHHKDSIKVIVENTHKCLVSLAGTLPRNAIIYSPKINSGLFNVPWELTEEAIEVFLSFRTDVSWTVVEYE